MKKFLLKATAFVLSASSLLGLSPLVHAEDNNEISILAPGYDGGYLKEQLDKGVAGFEEATGAKVNIINVDWDDLNSKIVQLASANQAPDIMMIGTRSLKQFAEEGIIQPLDDYITPEFTEPRVESVLHAANIDGKQYGIPFAFSSRGLFYRSDLVEKAPTNWDELLETARQIKKDNPDMYAFYLPVDGPGTSIELMSFFYQNEGYIFNDKGEYEVNNAANVETLEYLAQFVQEDLVPSPLDSPRNEAAKMFINGDLAMFMSGPWEKEELDKASDKAPYLTAKLPKGKVEAVNIATDSYVIPKGAKNPELAWKFIDFMGQEEYQRPISEAFDWFPILKAEQFDERFQTEFMKPFSEIIEFGQPDPHTSNWDTFHRHFNLAIQEALTGEKTAQEALDDAQKALTQE